MITLPPKVFPASLLQDISMAPPLNGVDLKVNCVIWPDKYISNGYFWIAKNSIVDKYKLDAARAMGNITGILLDSTFWVDVDRLDKIGEEPPIIGQFAEAKRYKVQLHYVNEMLSSESSDWVTFRYGKHWYVFNWWYVYICETWAGSNDWVRINIKMKSRDGTKETSTWALLLMKEDKPVAGLVGVSARYNFV